jgi:glycosyltransferase involved in cell wall biosynthesis
MRVGVDATIWPNRRGFGRYCRNVVTRLVELDPGSEYVLVADGECPPEIAPPPGVRWQEVSVRRPASTLLTSSGRRGLVDLVRLSGAARRVRPDAFLFPSVDTYFPVPGVPAVVGLFDAISDERAEDMLPERRARLLWRLKQRLAVKDAAGLFTISEASRAALSASLGIPRERLAVLPGAADAAFFPREAAEVEKELLGVGLRPGEPFLLYAGGIGPHKGLEVLLDAYMSLASRRDVVPPLIVPGPFDDPAYGAVTAGERARAAAVEHPGSIRFTGWIEDSTLACLHTRAGAVVVPSLAEGFGLPAVEAAACGAAVVASDIPSHRETLADAALFVPPGDVPALSQALERLLEDPGLRDDLGRGARRAAGKLSWERSAVGLRDLLHRAAGSDGSAS